MNLNDLCSFDEGWNPPQVLLEHDLFKRRARDYNFSENKLAAVVRAGPLLLSYRC
jgi:hypothetical protein